MPTKKKTKKPELTLKRFTHSEQQSQETNAYHANVYWGKQYELSPFLSPWEKRLQEEVNCVEPESGIEWAKRKLEERSEDISNRSGN